MVLTRTTRMQQQKWSSGADGPTRLGFNADADYIEQRAAYDDGTTGAVLPVTDVLGGRYFRQSLTDGYAMHRVQGAAWEWIGGTIVPTRLRYRRGASTDVAWSTDVNAGGATATMTAGGELGTAGLVRSLVGGSAGAALETDLSTPSATGRWLVRTRAAGDRGVVAEAHDNAAGALFSAREVGGSYPWIVDARGRMRSQAPTSFGAAGLTDNVPIVSAASATDVTALDLYGRTVGGKPALRAFGNVGDETPLLSVLSTAVTVGRSGWGGGAVNLTAETINLTGTVDVTGSVDVDGDLVVGDDLTVADQISAEGGKVLTYESGSNFGLTSQVVLTGPVTTMRDSRHSLVHRKRIVNINATIGNTVAGDLYTFEFAPRTACHIEVNLTSQWQVFAPGSMGANGEPNTILLRLRILDQDNNVVWNGDEVYELTLHAYDLLNYVGRGQIVVADCPPVALSAGTTYKVQLWGRRDPATSISMLLRHLVGTIREGALIGT